MGEYSDLKHPQVITILKKLDRDNEDYRKHMNLELDEKIEQFREINTYFLSWNNIFNKKFKDEKLIYQDRILMRDKNGNLIKANSLSEEEKKENLVNI